MNRREVLKSGSGALALLGGGLLPVRALHSAARRAAESDRPYLSAALQSAVWLKSVRQETAHGVTWPRNPLEPNVFPSDLYSGAAGVLPFLLELHAATGDDAFLKEAMLGADHLIATELTDERLHDPEGDLGFYVGLAGLAYVMERVHQASRSSKYRLQAQRVVEVIEERTRAGTTWPDDNDIVSGVAGTGLFLLWWSRQAHDRKAMSLARTAGHALVSQGQSAPGGLAWRIRSNAPKYYPNFSHGTAGIAYFLAALSRESGEKAFLQTALQGAGHLRAITTCDQNGCLIHHHEPEGEQLYYLGWCHGPAGTSRLHRLLAHLTRDPSWRDAVFRAADGVLHSGIPEKSTEGFWNNVSPCCGTASVAAYMLSLHREYGDHRYLDFSCHMTEDLLHRATKDEHGMRWVQAENRVSPNEVIAQTGYMQGAAGIGTWLLRLDGHFQRRTSKGIFPDDIWV